MHVHINESREYVQAVGVNDFFARFFNAVGNLHDFTVFQQYVLLNYAVL